MADNPTYLTPEGLQKLKDELEYLRTVRRPEVAAQIHEAKSQGDISDSAGYEDAKIRQGFVEGRISTLQQILRNAVLIEAPASNDTAGLGSRVTVQEDGQEAEEFLIVGAAEADPVGGRISNESPLGKALMGAHAGDEVVVQAPSGDIRFRILEIR